MTAEGAPVHDVVPTEIVVRGRFGPALTSALGAYFEHVMAEPGRTRLIANVPDQPALLGLLDVLAALNLHIVSLNPVTGTADPEHAEGELSEGAALR